MHREHQDGEDLVSLRLIATEHAGEGGNASPPALGKYGKWDVCRRFSRNSY